MRKRAIIKTVVIIVLAVAVAVEGVFLILGRRPDAKASEFNLNISMEGLGRDIGQGLEDSIAGVLSQYASGIRPQDSISGTVKNVLYSDMTVDLVMSLAYPLLTQVLRDINMFDYAAYMDLYATGPLLAEKLAGKPYTCSDAQGNRKPLTDVLAGIEDWSEMDAKVTCEGSDGVKRTTTIWNSIEWGVKDEASFYTAMNDMGEGLRGFLEVALQGKERSVNVNVLDVLMKFSALPLNLDAARVYNASGKSGYELCLVPLFNTLGLDEGEYPSVAEFTGYTSIGDMWKAVFGSVVKVVEKAEADPLHALPNLFVNFAIAVESGDLVRSMSSMRLDAEFNKLAARVMNFSDGLLFNFGESLTDIIGKTGLVINGKFNELLDSLAGLVFKGEHDLPPMDINALKACATAKKLANGNTVYDADPKKTIDYLVNYFTDRKTLTVIVNALGIAGTPEGEAIVSSIEKSRAGLTDLFEAVLSLISAREEASEPST